MANISIDKFTGLTPAILDVIDSLEQKVFEKPISREAITKRLEGRKNTLILVALHSGSPCGFKIGYEYTLEAFYSWIGGVDPDFRRKGVASALMAEQHEIIKSLGYKFVRTSTKNVFREMLVLNIKAGFDVTGVQQKLGDLEHTILLEKKL